MTVSMIDRGESRGAARRVLMVLGLVALVAAVLLVFGVVSPASADCRPDGIPDYAGSGVNGQIDTKTAHPSGGNEYGLYGWAGLEWYTCDIGSPVPDVLAEMDTWAGNGLLGAGTGIAAVMTAMHKWTSDPGALLKPIDDKIVQLSQVTTDLFFGQWAYALIVFAALGVLVAAFTRNIRTVMMTLLSVLAACAFVSVVSTEPLTIAQSTDGVASAIVSAADAKALQYAGIPDSKGGTDAIWANTDESTGAILRDAMLQPMWRLGQTGTVAQSKTTEAMFDAATASWKEVADGYSADSKRDAYNTAVDAVKNTPAIANEYQTIKGQSYNRTGAGFLGMFMILTVALVRIPAEALLFLGLLVIRFIPLLGPIFAALAIPEQTRPAALTALKIVAAAVFNVIVFGLIASVHTSLTAILYVNVSNLFISTIISVLMTYLLLKLSKPYRSITRLATGAGVARELERAPEGPGNAAKGVLGLVTGTVVGSLVTGRGKDQNEKKLTTVDRGHAGPDSIHPGWSEAPPINDGWSAPPAGNSGASEVPSDGPFYRPEADGVLYQPETAGPVSPEQAVQPEASPNLLTEPEWDGGRWETNIFIPVTAGGGSEPASQFGEPVVRTSSEGTNHVRVEH